MFIESFKAPLLAPLQAPFDAPDSGTAYGTTFLKMVEAELGHSYPSNTVQIPDGWSGAVVFAAGTFAINGGAFGTTGSVVPSDLLQLQVTTATEYSTAAGGPVTIGGTLYDTWTVTTKADGIAAKYTDVDNYTELDHYE